MFKYITLLCLISVTGIHTTPSDYGWLKKTTCRIAKKATPTIAATLISIPMLWFAQNYLGFRYTVDLKTDQPKWIKKTKKS